VRSHLIEDNDMVPREERNHALFVGYAPYRTPRYAASIVVEHGGIGSKVAGPLARDILLEVQKRKIGDHVA
jgi:penicillin-binding protein 2